MHFQVPLLQELFKSAQAYKLMRRQSHPEESLVVSCVDFIAKAKTYGIYDVEGMSHELRNFLMFSVLNFL